MNPRQPLTIVAALSTALQLACAAPPAPSPSTSAASSDSAKAPAAPPAPNTSAASPAAETPDYKNTIRWSTASEVENFGYDVYRGDTAEGPWVRITANPVLGAGTTDEVQKYSYVDREIEPTRGYFYYVESISLGGVREKFTPVIAAKAKLPAAPTP